MFRYIVFSFLVADLIFNVDGCPPRAPITPEKEVRGNVYEILKHIISVDFLYYQCIEITL